MLADHLKADGLVDEIVSFCAPNLLGDDALAMFGSPGETKLAAALMPKLLRSGRLGLIFKIAI